MVKNWQKSVISISSVLRDALENLNANNRGIVFITDNGFLRGTITDGDVRRALLAGVDTNDSVEKVLNQKFISCQEGDSFEQAKDQMFEYAVQALPVLNDEGLLVGVHFLDESEFEARPNQALIMAGGLGSRLRPLTNDCPKPMLKIDGKPMLERIIENLKSQGFLDIYISINYLGDKIRDYFGTGENFGVSEKPTHSYYINAGIYCISPSVFADISGNEYLDMPDLILQKISEEQSVIGFPLHEYWADIGMASDYNKANSTFKDVFDT